mmetsp:Transcript_60779/g.168494  ORF Transcript_60779/g.168494 Transcript_60779/m.168494 type:complete len:214 (-) Transcript_60779:296-937(-)
MPMPLCRTATSCWVRSTALLVAPPRHSRAGAAQAVAQALAATAAVNARATMATAEGTAAATAGVPAAMAAAARTSSLAPSAARPRSAPATLATSVGVAPPSPRGGARRVSINAPAIAAAPGARTVQRNTSSCSLRCQSVPAASRAPRSRQRLPRCRCWRSLRCSSWQPGAVGRRRLWQSGRQRRTSRCALRAARSRQAAGKSGCCAQRRNWRP